MICYFFSLDMLFAKQINQTILSSFFHEFRTQQRIVLSIDIIGITYTVFTLLKAGSQIQAWLDYRVGVNGRVWQP